MKTSLIMFVWLSYLSICHGYRLLGMFPFHGKSHFVMFEQLMKGLAREGHQVDVISSFPLKKPYPNYTDIVKLTPPNMLMNNVSYEFMMSVLNSDPAHAVATICGNEICKYLGHPEILKLVRNPPNDPPYDAVLMEVFGAQCFAVIAHLWNVPLIGVSSTTLYPWLHRLIGQPENLAYVPNNCVTFVGDMNFWQRLYNSVDALLKQLYFNYLTTKPQDDILREHFGPDVPSVRELETRFAMILINSHIVLNKLQPMVPAAVEVGGLHVQDEDFDLQPELEKWMNDSKEGIVYFTFGSMVMIETFPREFLNIIYSSLRKIAPVRVLLKVPRPEKLPSGLPENVYTSPWMPQIKVLKHPNVRAFITHGGLMGTQEAVVCGVPMIGIPLFADQFKNIDGYVERNIALKLEFTKLTEKDMDEALHAILWNPIYKETARNISQRFVDQPLNSLDTAIYWIDYVIKYGNDVLRSPAVDLSWYQLHLVDVIAFLLLCAVGVIVFVLFLVCTILEIMKNGKTIQMNKDNAESKKIK